MNWRRWIGLTPSVADLALQLVQGAAQKGVADWIYDSSAGTLRQGSRVLQLGNIHLEYSRAPEKMRASLLQKYLLLMAPSTISNIWSIAQANIFPLLRSRYERIASEIESRRQTDTAPRRASRPFFGNLEQVLGYDHGSTISQARVTDVSEWGVSLDAAMERALGNLNGLAKPRWTEMGPAHWRLTSDEGYGDAYLQLPQTFASFPGKGRPLVMIPNRGVLLASGTEVPGGLEALLDAALLSMREAPWPLCGSLFTMTPAGVAQFAAPESALPAVASLARLDLSIAYDMQKAALQAHHDAIGDAVFVAKFNLMGANAQPLTSWCAWTEGIKSSLPVTDTVAFVRHLNGPKEMIRVAWDDMQEIAGHYCRQTTEDPKRVLVEGFPSSDEWLRLQTRKL